MLPTLYSENKNLEFKIIHLKKINPEEIFMFWI